MTGLSILIVANEFEPPSALLQFLESKGHRVTGTFSPEQAERFLQSSILDTPDLIVAFTGMRFDWVLQLARSNWDRRNSRNHAVRPQMITVDLNRQLNGFHDEFERAGSRLVGANETWLLSEVDRAQATIAKLVLGKPHCVQVHEHKDKVFFCHPGERLSRIYLAPLTDPVAELTASDRLLTFIGALMTMNGGFLSSFEIERRLKRHPLYKMSRFYVPSLTTIKTYLNEDCVEVFERAYERGKQGFNPKDVVERETRVGNQTGYRLKVSWEIKAISLSLASKSP